LWRILDRNADFWWTLRDENAPLFALMGFIASEGGMDDETPPEGEQFLIGDKATIKPKKSGYLYCFANDTWHTCRNNRGSVTLTVTRGR